MANIEPGTESLTLQSGWLALDFANTAEWHASDQPEEHLNHYADLVAWAQSIGLLSDQQSKRLLQKAQDYSAEAMLILDRAFTLREAIYRIFSAVAGNYPVDGADLVLLNEGLSRALSQARIVSAADQFSWDWAGDETALDQILWPVAWSAAQLLTSEQLSRVGRCADDRGCGWLFLDLSRNRSRRWCTMKGCGNRAKARRYQRRQHNVSD